MVRSGSENRGRSKETSTASTQRNRLLAANAAYGTTSGVTVEKMPTPPTPTVQCRLSLSVEEVEKCPVLLELYADEAPKACENFLTLCRGTVDQYGHKMEYRDSLIYKIVPDWVLVGGDFVNNNGTGGKSIFDANEFPDEKCSNVDDFAEAGLLCMLNHGPNTNTSLFFITLKPAEWIKDLYVVFGKVVGDLGPLLQLAREAGAPSGIPTKTVKISGCEQI